MQFTLQLVATPDAEASIVLTFTSATGAQSEFVLCAPAGAPGACASGGTYTRTFAGLPSGPLSYEIDLAGVNGKLVLRQGTLDPSQQPAVFLDFDGIVGAPTPSPSASPPASPSPSPSPSASPSPWPSASATPSTSPSASSAPAADPLAGLLSRL